MLESSGLNNDCFGESGLFYEKNTEHGNIKQVIKYLMT